MERASRLFVLASLLIAGAVHAWLASGREGLAPAIAVAFVVGAVIGWFTPSIAFVAALATTYLAPALLFTAFGASDYHTIAIWLAPLVGIALARASWTHWHIPDPWRVPAVGWALVLAFSWPIVAARELDFSLLAARTFDTTTSAYEAPPRLAAAWILIVTLTQLTGVVWFDALWARFSNDVNRFETIVIRPLVLSACVCAAAGVYQGAVDLHWLNLAEWSSIARASGLMLDANTAAMSAAMWAPVSVAIALRGRTRAFWFVGAVYVLLAAGLWHTGSRTGLVCLAIGTLGVMVAAGDRAAFARRRVVMAAAVASAIVIFAALTIAPRMPFGNPLRRVFDRLPRLEAADMQRFGNELWGRFGYAKAATAMVAEHPIAGVGVGAFHVVAPDYLYRDGRLHPVPDNAQNWWRHQIAELGLAGALPSLWMSMLALITIARGVTLRDPIPVVVSAVLTGVGVASLLGVPTQHPATWLAFATLLFWLIAVVPTRRAARAAASWQWAAVWILAMVVAIGQALEARGDLRIPRRAQRSQLPFAYGLTPSEGLSEYGEFRWTAGRAVSVLPLAGPWLQLTIWTPHSDVATRPVRYTVSFDGRAVVARESRDRAPQTYYLQMPRDHQFVMLEFDASREALADRALQIATSWVGGVPAGTPPDRVIPQ